MVFVICCTESLTSTKMTILLVNSELNSDVATLATVMSIVYHGRSWLYMYMYTLVMVAM